MAKKPPQFGRPIRAPDSEIPEHLRGKPKTARFLQNADVTDFAWSGDDGTLDPASLTARLVEPRALFKTVLEAIVAAHPMEGPSPEARVDAALEMLLGETRKSGRKPYDWYDGPLRTMAIEYLAGFYRLKPAHNSLDALARYALRQDPRSDPEQEDSRAKTLRKRFLAEKNALLAQVSSGTDYDVGAAKARAQAAIAAIGELGVSVGRRRRPRKTGATSSRE